MKGITKALLLIIFSGINSYCAIAQQDGHIVSGPMIERPGQLLPGATLQLISFTDTLSRKVLITGVNGRFSFSRIKTGAYFLRIFFLGYKTTQTVPSMIDTNVNFPPIILEESLTTLGEVKISGIRPVIEQQIERTIVNVSSSLIGSSGNASDVLANLPGLQADPKGEMSLNGRAGLQVMLNGRSLSMQGQELSNYLRGLSASDIDKVELVNRPGAGYDASGTGGVVNIILKRPRREGVSAQLSLANGVGRYAKTNNGITFAINTGKINFFLNYNYIYRGDYTKIDLERKFSDNGGFKQNYFQDITSWVHNFRMGLDLELSKKTNLAVDVNAGGYLVNRNTDNRSSFQEYSNGLMSRSSINEVATRRRSFGAALKLLHKFHTSGRQLSFDADYFKYRLEDQQNYCIADDFEVTSYDSVVSKLTSFSDIPLEIRSTKLNYTGRLGKYSYETGYRSSYVSVKSKMDIFDFSSGTAISATDLSSDFNYQEFLNGAFINFSGGFGSFAFQAGIRYEYTYAKSRLAGIDKNSILKYGKAFPNFLLTYKDEIHAFQVNSSCKLSTLRPTIRHYIQILIHEKSDNDSGCVDA